MNEKITVGELKKVTSRINKERKRSMAIQVCVGISFLMVTLICISCSQLTAGYLVAGAVAHTLPEQSYTTAVFGSGQGETYECSQTRYDSYNSERDYEVEHPSLHSWDYEVEHLSSMLNKHGITVFRIDPTNPEHQRRYRRHLEGRDI